VEKMRVFEKTFGIDQLNTMVKKLEHQMKVSAAPRLTLWEYRIRALTREAPLSLARMI
jgi:hypothetical protein